MQTFYLELIKEIKRKDYSDRQLAKLKRDLSLKYKQKRIPTNIEILLACKKEDLNLLKEKLLTKPTRTISGVAPIAIMTKPAECPHGKCAMCPGGLKSHFGDVPQSYTGKEPATMRGIRNKYDSYLQVFNRLEQYTLLGHSIDKAELIIMGGTFPSLPIKYREEFVWGAFKAMNDFSKLFFVKNNFNFLKFKKFFELPAENFGDKKRIERTHKRLLKLKCQSPLVDSEHAQEPSRFLTGRFKNGELEKEQKRNEKAKARGIALCIETRPDYCGEKEIREMLKLGCTRVELGVQHLDDKVLKRIERGHSAEETVKATKLLKDNYFKVGFHLMPGLPGSSIKDDKKMFLELFNNPDFRPDALKIYPCMVTEGTKVHDWFEKKKYHPLDTKTAAKLISWFKERTPEYVRILRVQRDIPTYQTVAGVDMTNLRQFIHEKYRPNCRCIRCREPKKEEINFKDVKIRILNYSASDGEEFFISAEDIKKDILLGFCRLRVSEEKGQKKAGIRELHVYGAAVSVGEKGAIQHRGLGKKLLQIAEDIVKKNGIQKLKVISGIGVRDYYRKLGYQKEKTYMVKNFKKIIKKQN